MVMVEVLEVSRAITKTRKAGGTASRNTTSTTRNQPSHPANETTHHRHLAQRERLSHRNRKSLKLTCSPSMIRPLLHPRLMEKQQPQHHRVTLAHFNQAPEMTTTLMTSNPQLPLHPQLPLRNQQQAPFQFHHQPQHPPQPQQRNSPLLNLVPVPRAKT